MKHILGMSWWNTCSRRARDTGRKWSDIEEDILVANWFNPTLELYCTELSASFTVHHPRNNGAPFVFTQQVSSIAGWGSSLKTQLKVTIQVCTSMSILSPLPCYQATVETSRWKAGERHGKSWLTSTKIMLFSEIKGLNSAVHPLVDDS